MTIRDVRTCKLETMTAFVRSTGVPNEARDTANQNIWVTLTGLPLTIKLEWPFHLSTSGADFWVLHGDIELAGSTLWWL
jgi:hypothetical protein